MSRSTSLVLKRSSHNFTLISRFFFKSSAKDTASFVEALYVPSILRGSPTTSSLISFSFIISLSLAMTFSFASRGIAKSPWAVMPSASLIASPILFDPTSSASTLMRQPSLPFRRRFCCIRASRFSSRRLSRPQGPLRRVYLRAYCI